MKKILIFIFSLTKIAFGQNSVETNPSGNFGIIYSKGMGINNHVKPGKTNTYVSTGSTSTSTAATAVYGISNNSILANYGLMGEAAGSSNFGYGVAGFSTGVTSVRSVGVFGYSDVLNGYGYGMYAYANMNSIASDYGYGAEFASQTGPSVNGSAKSYGVLANSVGTGSVWERVGLNANAEGIASNSSYGVKASANNSGNGTTYGGYFNAFGSGTGNKYGIYSEASGPTNNYAAWLNGSVAMGSFGNQRLSFSSNQIDSWNGLNSMPMFLNYNSNGGVLIKGGLQVASGDLYLGDSYSVFRDKSGSADLLPIAYGNVSAAGVVQNVSSTSNISVTKTSTGTYQISVTGELFAPGLNAYTVVATLKDSYGFLVPSGNGTNLIINTANTSGTNTDKAFTFVIYK